jgi:hypothetical protein
MKRDAHPGDAELFRAARLERAPESLRAALLGAQPSRVVRPEERVLPQQGGIKRRRRLLGAAGAGVAAAAGVAAVWWFSPSGEIKVPMSAEQLSVRVTPPVLAADPKIPAQRTHMAPKPVVARNAAPRGVAPTPTAATLPETPKPIARPESEQLRAEDAEAAPALPRATFAEQLDVIKQARSALRAGQSREALAVLDRRDTVLRGGALEAEGRLLRIESLAASGRSPQARELARRFIADYPNSPLSARAKVFAQAPAP